MKTTFNIFSYFYKELSSISHIYFGETFSAYPSNIAALPEHVESFTC